MTEHYLDHQNLIRSEAWKRVRQNPSLDFEDLVSSGNLAYVEALQTHDPGKGKFSTHLTWKLRHRLGQANSQAIDWGNHTTELDEAYCLPDPGSTPLESGSLSEALAGLGAEAREVVDLILGSAGEFADFTMGTVKVTKTHIQQCLRGWGWTWRRIESVMTEIRVMLREM